MDFFSKSSIAENEVLPAREGAWQQKPAPCQQKM
jgi:hypothetical protein